MADQSSSGGVGSDITLEREFKSCFAKLFVELLRAVRSPESPQYRANATAFLRTWTDILDENPITSLQDVIEFAVQKVGYRGWPKEEYDRDLLRVARAAITYLIEAGAADGAGSGLLTVREKEFRTAIDGFCESRERRRLGQSQ